jgi:CII-binding regulator of phage lambda lysogenization HflD
MYANPLIEDLISQIKDRLVVSGPVIETPMIEEEAAAFLKSSRRQLQRWRQTGEGPVYHRMGKRRVVYYRADLISWLGGRRHTSTSAEGYRRKRAA